MTLSIVIPVYKVEKYVEKCLRSCAEQDIFSDEYEIIVVNDGSPDKSIEIVEHVAKGYSNITVVSQKNQGLSLARNKGLSSAKGDYVWFVDSDDWIEKNVLKKLITLCTENNLDILRFCVGNVIEGKSVRRFNYEAREKRIQKGKDVLLDGIYSPCVQFSIYKREFLLKNNLSFYPGIFHEDGEFTPRAWYMAERVMLLNDICYYYRLNNDSIMGRPNPKKSFDLVIVCESLNNFSKKVDDRHKIYFHNMISTCLNNALYGTYFMENEDNIRLNALLRQKVFLLEHLRKSTIRKYNVEYWLFRIIPAYIIVYRVIQLLNKKNWNFKKRRW